jgi:L-fuculose-phosphate aldolase
MDGFQKDRFFMTEREAREALCEIGRRVWQREYIASNDGNFSVRLAHDRILCTPTMVSKGFMEPEDLPIVDLQGKLVAGRKPPTSEIKIHLSIYQHRSDVNAIVHVHPPHATAFAVVRRNLPKCVLPEVEIFLGEIPMIPYATPGTAAFAEAAVPYLEHHNAFLLTNHGAITLGKDPMEAYYRMETVEQYCRILILASHLGTLQQLDYEAMMDLLRLRQKLGHPDRRLMEGTGDLCTPGVPPSSSVCSSHEKTVQPPFKESCSQSAFPGAQEKEQLIETIVKRVVERLSRDH